jgi:hypothetical protein
LGSPQTGVKGGKETAENDDEAGSGVPVESVRCEKGQPSCGVRAGHGEAGVELTTGIP